MASPLLHLTSPQDWRAALHAGAVRPPSLRQQGFVHLSTPEQVAVPANRLYAHLADALLLCVDPDRVTDEIRYEPGDGDDPGGMRFPHLYGPLPASAVIAAVPYRRDPEGRFGAPAGIPAADDVAGRAAAFGRPCPPCLVRRGPLDATVPRGRQQAEQVDPRVIDHLWRRYATEPPPLPDHHLARVHDVASFDGNLAVAGARLQVGGASAALDAVLCLPEHRRQGHAGAAVAAALAIAGQAGCDLVIADAPADGWARDWLARLGFAPPEPV